MKKSPEAVYCNITITPFATKFSCFKSDLAKADLKRLTETVMPDTNMLVTIHALKTSL